MSRPLIIGAAFVSAALLAVAYRLPTADKGPSGRTAGADASASGASAAGTLSAITSTTPAPPFASLVPEDTFFLLEIKSLNALDPFLSTFGSDSPGSSQMILEMMMSAIDADFSSINPNDPFLLTMGPGGPDKKVGVAVILPVPAPTLFAKEAKLPEEFSHTLTRPNYLGISNRKDYAASNRIAPILNDLPDDTLVLRVRPGEMSTQAGATFAAGMRESPEMVELLGKKTSRITALLMQVMELEATASGAGEMQDSSFGVELQPDSEFLLSTPEQLVGETPARQHELGVHADARASASVHFSWDNAALSPFLFKVADEFGAPDSIAELEPLLALLGGELCCNIYFRKDSRSLSLYANIGADEQEQIFLKARMALPVLLGMADLVVTQSEEVALDQGHALRVHWGQGKRLQQLGARGSTAGRLELSKGCVEFAVRAGHLLVMVGDEERNWNNERALLGQPTVLESAVAAWIPEASSQPLLISSRVENYATELGMLELTLMWEGQDPEEVMTRLRRIRRGRKNNYYMDLVASGAIWRMSSRVNIAKMSSFNQECLSVMEFLDRR